MLAILTTLLLIGAVATIALALGLPLRNESDRESSTRHPATRQSRTGSLPELASFEPILARNWRAPLNDAPAAANMPPESGTPSGSLTLAGTVGTSLALVRRADGTVEVKGVGESIDGAELVAIRPHEIELQSAAGERTILRKPVEPEQ